MTTQFQELLAELGKIDGDADTMAKAIEANAADPAATVDEDEEDDEDIAADGQDDESIAAAAGEDGEPVLGKSMTAVGADGKKHNVIDATDFLKSLVERVEGLDGTMAKAMGGILGTMKKQGDLIKSLGDQVASLSAQGRGRKSTLMVNEKPGVGDTMAKSSPASDAITPTDLMAKANAAYDQELISGVQLNTISVCLRERQAIPAEILSKVASAK